jgi:hypothetical protein
MISFLTSSIKFVDQELKYLSDFKFQLNKQLVIQKTNSKNRSISAWDYCQAEFRFILSFEYSLTERNMNNYYTLGVYMKSGVRFLDGH